MCALPNTADSVNRALTFCIPSFGSSTFLIETLESIRRQSEPCFAIVCIGGAPTQAISEYCEKYNWIRLECMDPDPGMVTCWSRAADLSTTDFLCFLADDNTVTPSYTEEMTAFLKSHVDVDFVFCSQNHMEPDGAIDEAKTAVFNQQFGRDELTPGPIEDDAIHSLIERSSIPLESSVFRRSVWSRFGPFEPESRGAFDIHFIFKSLLGGAKAGFTADSMMNFRWHDDAYSSRARQHHLEGRIHTLKDLEENSSEHYPSFFQAKRRHSECRLLRFKLPLAKRISHSIRLSLNGYLLDVGKQNLAWALGKSG